MYAFNRVNRAGLRYEFMEVSEDQTRVRTGGKTLVLNHNIHTLDQSWYDWNSSGQFIQTAFSYLTPDEREFLHDGIVGS
jgi:hypothetical protein